MAELTCPMPNCDGEVRLDWMGPGKAFYSCYKCRVCLPERRTEAEALAHLREEQRLHRVTVDRPIPSLIVIAAFRYCLGRQTYIVSECSRWLRDTWSDLDAGTRQLIVKETEIAMDKGLISDIDRPQWEAVLEVDRG